MLTAGFLSAADLKARIWPNNMQSRADHDAEIAALGLGVAGAMQDWCNRWLERRAGHVYACGAVRRETVYLDIYPVETLTSLTWTPYGESAEDLEPYDVNLKSGVIDLGVAITGGTITATVTGGYWLDDGNAQPAGSVALPESIRHAFELQCQAVAERTNLFGARAARKRGEVKEAGLDDAGLIEPVREILMRYRRRGN